LSPIIISWVRPNGYGYIYFNFREKTRVLETFVHFIRGKEARRGLERKLGEGKNLELE